ncbi:MAG: SLBB domain-containing protein [Chitinophagales bacterium]|nr:SLBB domain-containing protein [Chitinophagales bacterium]
MRYLLLSLLVLCGSVQLLAQTANPLEAQARSAIQAKGLEEEAVRERLKSRGIQIDALTPEQLIQLQPTIEGVLNEMEAEKNAEANPEAAENPAATGGEMPVSAPAQKTADTPVKATPATKKIEPPKTPTEIYGHQLFRNKDLAIFQTTSDVKPPDSYVLGVGDELTISVFGPSQFDSKFIINNEGYISPSQMPKIFLKGLTFGQAKALLRSRFSNFYRFAPEQFAVSISTARNILVNVFGEAVNVGSFNVSAANTAFNALVAAGGPTELGSVRNIKIIRGKETRNLDLYALINNPALQNEFYLENNDILHVPVAERIVAIGGAVRRAFKYELRSSENLNELLQFAGGLNANAYKEVIQVSRYVNDQQVLIDVNLKQLLDQKGNFTLLDGDLVLVREIPTAIENTASIQGAVALPGAYALSETPRLSDLLKKGGLRPESRTDLAFLLRTNPDSTRKLLQLNLDQVLPGSSEDLALQPRDLLTVYAKARYADRMSIRVMGAVRDTLPEYPFDPDSSITLARAILLAGGLRPDANGFGYILRTNPNNKKERDYLAVNISEALRQPDGRQNVRLRAWDEVRALSALDYTDVADVNVVGAVRNPGKYRYSPTLSLKDVLLLSGGLKLEAAQNRVDVYRVQFDNNKPTRTLAITVEVNEQLDINGGSAFRLQPFDEIVVRTVPDFELQEFVELNGEVLYPGRYALINDNEPLSSVIKRAGGLSPEADAHAATLYRTEQNKGFVVTRLDKALRNPSSPENHLLRGGDVINVPKYQHLVTIKAANTDLTQIFRTNVKNTGQISVAYNPGKRAGWYIKHYAGGFSKDANRSKVRVELPNGKVNRTKNVLGVIKIWPKVGKGGTVHVPIKKKKDAPIAKKDKKEFDWDKALTQILAVAGTAATITLAISALK